MADRVATEMPMEKRRLREGEVLVTLPHKKPKMDDWDKYQMDHLKVRCADETLTPACFADETLTPACAGRVRTRQAANG